MEAGQAAGHFGAELRHLGPDGLDHLLVSFYKMYSPGPNGLTSLSLHFFICKIGVLIDSTSSQE